MGDPGRPDGLRGEQLHGDPVGGSWHPVQVVAGQDRRRAVPDKADQGPVDSGCPTHVRIAAGDVGRTPEAGEQHRAPRGVRLVVIGQTQIASRRTTCFDEAR